MPDSKSSLEILKNKSDTFSSTMCGSFTSWLLACDELVDFCRTIAPARRDALHLYSLSMIFVFEVRVKEGWSAEAYADAWVRASEIIQRAPGSRGTRLHRSIGDPGYLLAIASWDSKTARDAMEAHPSEEVRRIIASQAEFVDINVIGEFEDPDWVVQPDR